MKALNSAPKVKTKVGTVRNQGIISLSLTTLNIIGFKMHNPKKRDTL